MTWYEEEVVRVEKEFSELTYEPETVFYGSSSFTLWTSLYDDFAELKPVNLGFGGSTLAACSWFFDRLLAPVTSAKTIIIYAGDNDLGDGRDPAEVCLFYRQLIAQIRQSFGNVPVFFISVKPSLQRWEIIDRIKLTNTLIREEIGKDAFQHFIDIYPSMVNYQGYPRKSLFEPDGLHLSRDGYALWRKIILENLNASVRSEELLKAP
ncbi:GDSL-type esterase/lipase family protein [Dyadobacter pollutisoli]|uniref:GDSL-type esterase/lipase family protein n=1 Tax=Dyadobacter pollutisoli TaxID=2910158 RepID=A0A9E8NF14_9BACT|nr:GDSL-type esterase/lipase family protein [Dyadobacter pollutisoli]WAC13761.1 GDSL-type esterase/lipase family protein [Dyadobacter pollutisoli]